MRISDWSSDVCSSDLDRYADADGNGLTIYDIDFEYLPGVDRHPVGAGFREIDHLPHNVYTGRMKYWADYYESLFNFREIRYFDIKGDYRSEEHTTELQYLMSISYDVF